MIALNSTLASAASTAQPQPTKLVANGTTDTSGATFSTVLDALNPLQHIPVISGMYRATVGSSISPVSQLAGDTLYGGLVGGAISSFVTSLADIAVKQVSGKDISEHVVSALDTPAETSTRLVPAPADSIPAVAAKDAATSQEQVDSALQNILHPGAHPERVAAQYKRAQTLDITNQILAKAL